MDSLSDVVACTNPLSLPASFLGLELVVYIAFALTVRHALGESARGNTYHVFQWAVLFIYGLIMEIVSFNFFDNYQHATFSVQFYYGQLPLYVTCIYLVFHYTGIKLVERFGLPRLQEGMLAGLAIMAIDVPFDTLGVGAGWWVWRDNSLTAIHPRFIEAVATRFYDVPVTSYYWYLMYGALLAIFSRTAYGWVWKRSLAIRVCAAPLVSVSVFVVGAMAFEALFWTPRSFGMPDGAIVFTYLAIVWGYALTLRAPAAQPVAPWIVFNLGVFYAFHLGLLVALWVAGTLPSAGARLGLCLLSGTGLVLLARVLPLRTSRAVSANAASGAASLLRSRPV